MIRVVCAVILKDDEVVMAQRIFTIPDTKIFLKNH